MVTTMRTVSGASVRCRMISRSITETEQRCSTSSTTASAIGMGHPLSVVQLPERERARASRSPRGRS